MGDLNFKFLHVGDLDFKSLYVKIQILKLETVSPFCQRQAQNITWWEFKKQNNVYFHQQLTDSKLLTAVTPLTTVLS